jgi:hypothetical protein
MRFRVALLVAAVGCLTSCASGPLLLRLVEEPPSLSQADSRAMHLAARKRLDTIAPRSSILEIRVVNASEVSARFDTDQDTYFMILQKRAGAWHVIRIERLSPNDILI